MTHRRATTLLVAGVTALALSACSSSTSQPNPSGSEGGAYTDPDYGFQLAVEPGYAQGTQTSTILVNTPDLVPAARNVMFYDTANVITREDAPKDIPDAQSVAKQLPPGGSIYPTTFMVSVFPLGEAVTTANLDDAKSELQEYVLSDLTKDLAQGGVTPGPLQDTTVAGRPAFVTELQPQKGQSGQSSLQLRTKIYWVFAEQDQYQITEQAPVSQWQQDEKALDAMLSSVVLPGTWESSSPSSSSTGSQEPSSSASPSASS